MDDVYLAIVTRRRRLMDAPTICTYNIRLVEEVRRLLNMFLYLFPLDYTDVGLYVRMRTKGGRPTYDLVCAAMADVY